MFSTYKKNRKIKIEKKKIHYGCKRMYNTTCLGINEQNKKNHAENLGNKTIKALDKEI